MFSNEIRKLVEHHHGLGKSYTEIAEIMNISRNSVRSMMLYRKKAQKQKRGPKNIINDHLRLAIRRCTERLNQESKLVNCNVIIKELDLNVSRRTVNNFFLRSEYKYSNIRQDLSLSKAHKLKRVNIVSEWIENNINWNETVFTDEKRFDLDGPNNAY